jgi:hypothetical protein
VVLDGHAVFGLDPHRCLGERFLRIAALVQVRRFAVAHRGAAALPFEVGDMLLRLIVDADERGREARNLRLLRHDHRDGLAAEPNLVVIEGAERRARRRDFVAVFVVR